MGVEGNDVSLPRLRWDLKGGFFSSIANIGVEGSCSLSMQILRDKPPSWRDELILFRSFRDGILFIGIDLLLIDSEFASIHGFRFFIFLFRN
jgi:hypothetical protein